LLVTSCVWQPPNSNYLNPKPFSDISQVGAEAAPIFSCFFSVVFTYTHVLIWIKTHATRLRTENQNTAISTLNCYLDTCLPVAHKQLWPAEYATLPFNANQCASQCVNVSKQSRLPWHVTCHCPRDRHKGVLRLVSTVSAYQMPHPTSSGQASTLECVPGAPCDHRCLRCRWPATSLDCSCSSEKPGTWMDSWQHCALNWMRHEQRCSSTISAGPVIVAGDFAYQLIKAEL
jgi:hypothetical protein